jgi:hypothetical protein
MTPSRALLFALCLTTMGTGAALAQDCSKCHGFPTICTDVDNCLKRCNVAPVQAQNCFQAGKIDLNHCKALYPQCKGDDPACAACRSYPSECRTIDKCIQHCNVAPVQAKNCYEAKLISLEQCNTLYNKCVDPCDGCNGFPSECAKIDTCVQKCNVAPVQAQNCFQAGKIELSHCKALYPQCKGDDPACASCRSYPSECRSIDTCIHKCNVAPVQAQNCYQARYINLDQCKRLYPACK